MSFPNLTRRTLIGAAVSAALGTRVAANAQTPSPIAGERTIEHAAGTTTLTGEPQRIVVLEWYLLEQLLAAGVQPVGVADIDGYNEFVSLPLDLNAGAVDVGTRQEPSMESIAGLAPDLILADDGRHEAIYEQLNDIAPTILVPFDDRSDDVAPMDDLYNRVTLIGDAIGRPDAASESLTAMETTIEEQTTRLEDAGLAGAPFVIVSWYTNNTDPTMRLFSDQHIVGDAVSALGLENQWPHNGEEVGFSTVGFEALATLAPETHFVYVPMDDGEFTEMLATDPILSSLPFVQEGRTYELASDTWTNPGTVGVEVLVTRVTDALTGKAGA